jgi:hypothetical protein
MTDGSGGPAPLNGYHAHVHYDAATRPVAELLPTAWMPDRCCRPACEQAPTYIEGVIISIIKWISHAE